jgi:hypothetical protein
MLMTYNSVKDFSRIKIAQNLAVDMHNHVMMVNWFSNDNTDIHDGLNTLSFTIVIVSSEQGQYKKHTLLECR